MADGYRGGEYRKWSPVRALIGADANAQSVAAMLLLLFVSIIVYVAFILPGIESVQCGKTWDADYKAEQAAPPKKWIALDGTTELAEPVCGLAVRSGDDKYEEKVTHETHVPDVLRNISKFLPFLMLAPLGFLIGRQTASAGSGPAIWAMLLITGLLAAGHTNTISWVIVFVSVIVACIPLLVQGTIAALSHISALVLWPEVVILTSKLSAADDLPVSDTLVWMLEMAVWVVLLGSLIVVPMTWWRRGEEE